MKLEIERKWLIGGFPDLPALQECDMEQGYLAFEPSAVRIRKAVTSAGANYKLTVKGSGTLVRTEVDLDLDEAQYEALKTLLVTPVATKRHRTYRLPGGEILECSLVDENEDCAFYYAEVEFETVEQARAFRPPAFLGREVTEEGGWTMAAHCRRKAERQFSNPFSSVLLEGLEQ